MFVGYKGEQIYTMVVVSLFPFCCKVEILQLQLLQSEIKSVSIESCELICNFYWPTAFMALATDHCNHGDRQTRRHHCHQCLLFSVPHKHTQRHTHTHTQSPISTICAGPAACVLSAQDTELKGHSVLLLSPVKCHQATPALSSLVVSHAKSLWTISYSLAAEVH